MLPTTSACRTTVSAAVSMTLLAAMASLSAVAHADAGGRRFSGTNRFETAVLANREVHPDPGLAVLARADEFADALAGSFLGGWTSSPLVFTYRDEIPAETLEYLRASDVQEVRLMGGRAAISERVEEQLRDEGIDYLRHDGADRIETAAGLVGGRGGSASEISPDLVLVNGYSFADAVSAAPAAYRFLWPVALTAADELPEPTRALIERFRPNRLHVIGGQAAVSDAVVAEAAAVGCDTDEPCRTVERFAGADRYSTAAAVADWLVDRGGFSAALVQLARGDVFPDALAAGALGGERGSPTLLTEPSELSDATRAWLESRASMTDLVDVLGSPDAVSDQVWQDAQAAAG